MTKMTLCLPRSVSSFAASAVAVFAIACSGRVAEIEPTPNVVVEPPSLPPVVVDRPPVPKGDGGRDTSDAGPGTGDAGPDATDPVTEPCAKSTFFRDSDGDGFGDPDSVIEACEAPAGYVAVAGDCMDTSSDVHPGQTAFFTTDRGDGQFDYDCDGSGTAKDPAKGASFCVCGIGPIAGCSRSSGWSDAVPGCGETAPWNAGSNGLDCEPIVVTSTQVCR